MMKTDIRGWIDLFEAYTAYHGTNQTFDAFSIDRGGMATGANAGAKHAFFFTDNPVEAEQYARHAGSRVVANIDQFEKEQERLRGDVERLEKLAHRTGNWEPYERAMEAWEKLEIDATQEDEEVGKRVIEAHITLDNPYEFDFQGVHGTMAQTVGNIEDIIVKAKAAGHDGVIFHNISDSPKGGFISTHYAVFSAKAIQITGEK